MYGYIYKTTNLINGKIYVGQHKSKVFNESYFGSGVAFLNALKKYGKENFKCEILEWCKDLKTTNEREIYWIAHFNSTDREIGYNITNGGWGVGSGEGHCWYGRNHTEETKEKMRQASLGELNPMYNREFSKEHIERIRLAVTGENNPFYGKEHSEETKKRLSQSRLGKYKGKDSPVSIQILAVDLEGNEFTFECISDASEYFNINKQTLYSGIQKNKDGFYTNNKTGIKFKRLNEDKEVS